MGRYVNSTWKSIKGISKSKAKGWRNLRKKLKPVKEAIQYGDKIDGEFGAFVEHVSSLPKYKDDIWKTIFADKILTFDWGSYTFDYSMATDGISTSLRYHCN